MMLSGRVVVLSDRPDRALPLADAIETIADCRVAGLDETWADIDSMLGVIADVTLWRPETKRCLKALVSRCSGRRMPIVHVGRHNSEAEVHQAQSLGATACLSALLDPKVIVAALFRQIRPEDTIAELIVERHVARTGTLMRTLFRTAAAGHIDLPAVEQGIDPVLNAVREGGLTRWLEVVREHDDVTFQHCLLVAGVTAGFTLSLGLSRGDCQRMVRAALVHDVGKSRIPLAILNKPGRLEPDEMTVMRTHAPIGHEILMASGPCDPVTLAVTRHHHEMLDGSGYPDGLSSDTIADPIRLLTICDIYSALIEKRAYKAAMPQDEALRILHGMEGKLEARLVDAFSRSIVTEPALPDRPARSARSADAA